MTGELTGKVKRTGGCACGEIRYGFYEPKVAQVACHCRACQYHSGGGPAHTVIVRRDEFRVTKGRPKEFVTLSEAGHHVTRAFCGDCGCPLYAYSDGDETHCSVKVGSLDEPENYKPRVHIWMSEAQKWDKPGWFTARFRKNPPFKARSSGGGA
ncbi:MAG: GFA family protein [Pseudomonadales bacterium]